MKSYVKIYGPPLLKAIRVLEKLAIDYPEVCIWDTMMDASMPMFQTQEGTMTYFAAAGGIPEKRCGSIVSKSGEKFGEFDFIFEWFKAPTMDQLNMLIEKIDETLAPLGVKYTITTR